MIFLNNNLNGDAQRLLVCYEPHEKLILVIIFWENTKKNKLYFSFHLFQEKYKYG